MHVFIGNKIEGTLIYLNEEESHHCAKVLRMNAGSKIRVITGDGFFYDSELLEVHHKTCVAKILTKTESSVHNYYFHLAIAPTKNIDRIEWMLEKCVELGIDEITFLQCEKSERKVVKIERIHKIVESAVKQSIQAKLPKVNELINFKDFINQQENFKGKKLIAHCNDNTQAIQNIAQEKDSTLCLIGPEGDFSNKEIELALQKNYSAISLGQTRLRTETAGLYVCSFLKSLNYF